VNYDPTPKRKSARALALVMTVVGGAALTAPPAAGLGAVAGATRHTVRSDASQNPMTSSGATRHRSGSHDDARSGVVELPHGVALQAEFLPAQSWYYVKDGVLSLREPQPDETHCLKLTLKDPATGRLLPAAKVLVAIVDARTREPLVTTTTLAPMWSKRESCYGANLALPAEAVGRQVQLCIEAGAPEGWLRAVDAQSALPISSLVTEVGPLTIPEGGKQAAGSAPHRTPTPKPLEGRHPPVEPTPYPGEEPSAQP